MKKRQIEILNKISESSEYSIDDCLNEFLISQRTLYYDLEEINYGISSFGQIKNFNKNLMFIGNSDLLKRFLKSKGYDLTTDERVELVLYKIMNERFNTIKESVDELKVSKNTIVNTIDDIRLFLQKRNLQLHYMDRYIVTGDERDTRNLYIKLMEKDINLIDFIHADVRQLNFEANLQLSDYSLACLSKLISFSKLRIARGFTINCSEELQIAKQFPYYDIVKKIFNLSEEESTYISAYTATLSSLNLYISKADIEHYVDELVRKFELKSAIYIQEIKSFKVFLARHILSSYYRIKFSFPIYNPILDDVKRKYSYLFYLVKSVISSIKFENLDQMSDDEIAYIVMYFGGNIKSHSSFKNRVVIVCPHGLMISKSIERQLINYIPMVDIIGSIPIYKLDEFKQEYDYIISTIPIANYPNAIIVHSILTKEDINLLMDKIVMWGNGDTNDVLTKILEVVEECCTIKNKDKLTKAICSVLNQEYELRRKEVSPMLKELLTRDKMNAVERCEDWKEAIALAAKPLLDQQLITYEYIEEMQKSLEKHGPYIVLANHFALPHASASNGVNQLSMSLLHVKEDVDVLGKPVNTFVVLATVDNNLHMRALSSLSELLYDENNLDKLLSGNLDLIDEMIQKTE